VREASPKRKKRAPTKKRAPIKVYFCGAYWPARITATAMNGKSCSVQYEDGSREAGIGPDRIRKEPEAEAEPEAEPEAHS